MKDIESLLYKIFGRFFKEKKTPQYLTGKRKELTDERCNDTSIKATRKSK
jgi:hypothetical protein